MMKEFMLRTCKLPMGGLLKNSVVKINDCPNMTSAVYRGRKATNQTKQKLKTETKDINLYFTFTKVW